MVSKRKLYFGVPGGGIDAPPLSPAWGRSIHAEASPKWLAVAWSVEQALRRMQDVGLFQPKIVIQAPQQVIEVPVARLVRFDVLCGEYGIEVHFQAGIAAANEMRSTFDRDDEFVVLLEVLQRVHGVGKLRPIGAPMRRICWLPRSSLRGPIPVPMRLYTTDKSCEYGIAGVASSVQTRVSRRSAASDPWSWMLRPSWRAARVHLKYLFPNRSAFRSNGMSAP